MSVDHGRFFYLPAAHTAGFPVTLSLLSKLGLLFLVNKISSCFCTQVSIHRNHAINWKLCFLSAYSFIMLACIIVVIRCSFNSGDRNVGSTDNTQYTPRVEEINSTQRIESSICKLQKPLGSETLPRGIIKATSDLEMRSLFGAPRRKISSKNLLAIAVGIKQKEIVDQIVTKFFSSDFHVMLFHYDRAVDEWRGFPWCDKAIHVYAVNQTKWWFAKRFLHPDIVSEYSYIFLWDEDLGVENFHPGRYLEIVREEGLEISQPALKTGRGSSVHHSITARQQRNKVHRRFYKLTGGKGCLENSTGPPCTGWVEMMAPAFTSAAWRCAWHMIQNDLIYAWGLDYRLGYCAQGERTRKIGVVDAEYVVHKGLPTLGGLDPGKGASEPSSPNRDRLNVRLRSYAELEIFKKRWRAAEEEDQCWTDPYPA